MKKFLILNSAFLILNLVSNAQVFILGGKGILNYSTFMNDNANINGTKLDKEFTMGGQGGIYFRYYFNEATYYNNTNVSLAIELLFGSYGQKYKANLVDTSAHSKISVSSMDIPVMVHVRGQAGLYAEAGVSFGMINGVTYDFSRDPDSNPSSNFSGAVDSSFASSNLSGIFGFGIDSELNDKLNLTIGFRLTYGLTDLTEPQKSNSTDYKETHSATVGFVVGVAYILNFFHDYH
ncbi:MAG TPA: outer membrane beta-barrel protein [Bacteroidia bacterium]|nr:outer membrane beta-barrel protein [Bacteroidia bacterium]